MRSARQDDIQPLAELWARAFPGARSAEERIRHLETGGVFGGIETTWIAEQDGALAGAFRAYAMTQHMHGAEYGMMGLAAVAVDETARRRGLGRSLCEHAIRVALERGDTLSMLYPFRPAFYNALGWGLVGELHAHRFAPEHLTTTRAGRVRRSSETDSAAISACYARVAATSNGLIARTPRVWRSHLQANGTNIYVTGTGRVRGYLLAHYSRFQSPDRRVLHVRELIAEDHESYETLLGWIASQRDAWRVVQYDASPDERFAHRLVEPRTRGFTYRRALWAPVARVIRGPMLRVLDVTRAFELRRRWGNVGPLRFTLHVDDTIVAGNRGPFIVEFDGGSAHVERSADGSDPARPVLRLTAPALAQVFAGELSLRDVLNLGTASCDGDASALDALFRVDRCFRLLDEF